MLESPNHIEPVKPGQYLTRVPEEEKLMGKDIVLFLLQLEAIIRNIPELPNILSSIEIQNNLSPEKLSDIREALMSFFRENRRHLRKILPEIDPNIQLDILFPNSHS